jgi:hypothetical protein
MLYQQVRRLDRHRRKKLLQARVPSKKRALRNRAGFAMARGIRRDTAAAEFVTVRNGPN